MFKTLAGLSFVLVVLSAVIDVRAQVQDHLHDAGAPRTYDGPPLSLQQAINEALQHNPALIALRQQFEVARLRPAQERYLMPPTLEAQIWQWPITTVNPLNTNMYMFTMQQEVPGPGKRALRTALGEADAAMAAADIAVRARDVINQVMRAYADLVVARRSIDVHLISVDVLRQFADASTIEYAAGRRPQQDVLKAVAEISKLHEDLVMHEESAGLATARINVLLDRDPEAPIGLLDSPHDSLSLRPSAELQQLALTNQPELTAARAAVDRAKAALGVASRDEKPDFVVGGGYMLMPREAGAWTASVGITWPNAPWSRGRVEAKKAEVSAEIGGATANVKAVERNVQLAVHEAYVRATAATQRVALLRTTVVPQSAQTVEAARIAYQTNRLDFLSVLDDQRTLLDAELGYVRALSDRESALADLARAVGVDVANLVAPVAAQEVSR